MCQNAQRADDEKCGKDRGRSFVNSNNVTVHTSSHTRMLPASGTDHDGDKPNAKEKANKQNPEAEEPQPPPNTNAAIPVHTDEPGNAAATTTWQSEQNKPTSSRDTSRDTTTDAKDDNASITGNPQGTITKWMTPACSFEVIGTKEENARYVHGKAHGDHEEVQYATMKLPESRSASTAKDNAVKAYRSSMITYVDKLLHQEYASEFNTPKKASRRAARPITSASPDKNTTSNKNNCPWCGDKRHAGSMTGRLFVCPATKHVCITGNVTVTTHRPTCVPT